MDKDKSPKNDEDEWIAARDKVMMNPTLENATEWVRYNEQRMGMPPMPFKRETVPLAAVHKARLQWLHATDEMLKESLKWLTEHSYRTTFRGVPALTPESRDYQRKCLGMKPLNTEATET